MAYKYAHDLMSPWNKYDTGCDMHSLLILAEAVLVAMLVHQSGGTRIARKFFIMEVRRHVPRQVIIEAGMGAGRSLGP